MNTTHAFMRLITIGTISAMATGCGSGLSGPDHRGDPYYTFYGNLKAANPSQVPENIGVALLWSTWPRSIPEGHVKWQVSVAEVVEVEPTWPPKFKLGVYDLPPNHALHTLRELFEESYIRDQGADPNTKVAQAEVKIFLDTNNNGTMDLLNEKAGGHADSFLSPGDSKILVTYVEGGFYPLESDLRLDPGFHLVNHHRKDAFGNPDPILDGETIELPVEEYPNQTGICQDMEQFETHVDIHDQVCPSGGSCDYSKIPSGQIKCDENDENRFTYNYCQRDNLTTCSYKISCEQGEFACEKSGCPAGWPCN